MKDQAIYLIYDGECPLCSTSAKALKLRKAVGSLHLINARENHPIMQEINLANLNIDKGMVVKFNDILYHGADAQHLLAMLGSNNDFYNWINVWLFRSKTRAHLLYPLFRMVRNILLWFKSTPKINNLHNTSNDKQPICKSLFGNQWDLLPEVIHHRYAIRGYSNDSIQLEGKMEVYFSQLLSIFMPLFKIFGILVPYRGKDVPVTVTFHSSLDSNVFFIERIFYFPEKKPYYFYSHMITTSNNEAIEFMRFGFGWKMIYHYDDKKVILQHKGYVLKIFGANITLPISFLIGKVYVEELALSDDSYQMLMRITHPLFGKLFEYSGTFKIINSSI